MPRGKELNEFEKGQITGLRQSGTKPSEIAYKIKRSRKVVYNYLKLGSKYGQRHRSGRKRTISCRDFRMILRLSSSGMYSTNQIKGKLGLPQHRVTIWRYVRKIPYLRYRKRLRKLKMTSIQIKNRLDFAKNHMSWTHEWNKIIFSDEKKFNLDGPDGFQYYWHDLRREPQYFSKRVQGGGSVMVWAACASNGKTVLVFLNGSMDSTVYQKILENSLLPVGTSIGGENWIFQQDNAKPHTSKSSKNWFETQKVKLLEWPSNSPDLNIMENIWGILVRRVFVNGRQFSTVKQLKDEIINAWDSITVEDIQNLVNSMPNRIFSLIKTKGLKIDY